MSRIWVVITLILGFIGVTATNSYALDGKRKGFIIGAGAGTGLTSFKEKISVFESDRESKMALMTDFKLGYAPSNQFAIFWTSKVSWLRLKTEGNTFAPSNSFTIVNGMGGLGLAYYFQSEGPSPYLTAGFGFSSWGTPFEEGTDTFYGSGFALGAGYEFSRHWSIEGGLVLGSPKDADFDYSIDTMAIRLTINVLGY